MFAALLMKAVPIWASLLWGYDRGGVGPALILGKGPTLDGDPSPRIPTLKYLLKLCALGVVFKEAVPFSLGTFFLFVLDRTDQLANIAEPMVAGFLVCLPKPQLY
jgi:hypothetical protein